MNINEFAKKMETETKEFCLQSLRDNLSFGCGLPHNLTIYRRDGELVAIPHIGDSPRTADDSGNLIDDIVYGWEAGDYDPDSSIARSLAAYQQEKDIDADDLDLDIDDEDYADAIIEYLDDNWDEDEEEDKVEAQTKARMRATT